MHCRIALCSESMGMISPDPRSAADKTSSPPATRDSLLANARRWPASNAARVGSRPAAPTSALRTTSVSESAAAANTAPRPLAQFVTLSPTGSGTRSSAKTAKRGLNEATWAARASPLLPATKAVTWNWSGWRRITSSALWPIEPVEPRIATRITGSS